MATHRPFIFNCLKPTDKSVKIYSNKKTIGINRRATSYHYFNAKLKKSSGYASSTHGFLHPARIQYRSTTLRRTTL